MKNEGKEGMGLFDKVRNNKATKKVESLKDMAVSLAESGAIKKPADSNHNSFGEPLDKLVDGELPWGWVYAKRDFTNKVASEYQYFFNQWHSVIGKNPKEEYAALKSFVLYMYDIQKKCADMGECYEFWCNEILIGKDYLNKMENKLKAMEENIK